MFKICYHKIFKFCYYKPLHKYSIIEKQEDDMNTKKITTAAIFIALTTFFTMIVKIPVSPAMGYVNLGDFIILLSTVAFGPIIGMIAAAFGSALADLLLGYAAFSPFTFVVKGLMALVMGLFLKKVNNQKISTVLTAGVICELVMVVGYYFTSVILYGNKTAIATILPNSVQAAVNFVIFALIWKRFLKITESMLKN